ncbi:MAG: TonB-dependent receptor [Zymomonas mobilis subsp. pomaceae]|uniref:TonB-dependent receptor n=1 Tax=Zymomonas mobilis TaxID=542 RepID=UPI0039EC0293
MTYHYDNGSELLFRRWRRLISSATSFVVGITTTAYGQAAVAQLPKMTDSKTTATNIEKNDGDIIVTSRSGFQTANGVSGVEIGGGLIQKETAPKSVSHVSTDFIQKQAPSANAFDLVALLPGANVTASDPLGFSTQTNITVRGLSGDAIGYVLEGMPLNDVAYYTGYPTQFADSENYQQISLAQGSADLNSPVLNAAGGVMNLTFRKPAAKMGGYADFSYGSYNTNRQFVRLDTGEIGHSGVMGFVSYSHARTDNWRGPGYDEKQHVDFKLLKEWDNDNHVSLLGTWNKGITSYYPQVDKQSWQAYGISGSNNLNGRFNLNNDAAGTDYWRLYRAPEEIFYLAAPAKISLSNKVKLNITPYVQWDRGNVPAGSTLSETGLWNGTDPVTGSITLPNAQEGNATVRSNYTQKSSRAGINTSIEWKIKNHDFTFGYWYDYSSDKEQNTFTPVSETGYAPNIWADHRQTIINLPEGSPLLGADNRTHTYVNALYAGDHITLLHKKLTLDIGFKEAIMTRHGYNYLPGPQHKANFTTSEPLPRLGIRYQINPENQVFFSASTNFRTADETALYNSYDPTSGDLLVTGNKNLKNEYSISEELGYRYTSNRIIGSLTLFNYNFSNRQIQTVIVQNGSHIQSTINAGNQVSRGIDVEIGLSPWHHLSPYLSGEYLSAHQTDNLAVGDDFLLTKGKKAIRSPNFQGSIGITYDDHHFFGMASMKYTGSQYSSFLNDERIPAYVTGNLAIGYRFTQEAFLKHPELRLNFINIGNNHYLSGVATPTANAQDSIGKNGTVISGSAPQYYIGGGFAVLFSVSSAF